MKQEPSETVPARVQARQVEALVAFEGSGRGAGAAELWVWSGG